MFGRKGRDQPAPEVPVEARPGAKGRPTPTRKEAEAARKATLKVSSDPKEARKEMRERERAERQSGRAALMAGDERALPPRDAGPVRKMIRDVVDGRRSVGEIFIPVAILVLLSGFFATSFPVLVQVTYYVWLVMLAGVVLDVAWIVLKLRRTARETMPDARIGFADYLYGVMRSLTLRRLRLPPPKVGPGGKPVKPKAPKQGRER